MTALRFMTFSPYIPVTTSGDVLARRRVHNMPPPQADLQGAVPYILDLRR